MPLRPNMDLKEYAGIFWRHKWFVIFDIVIILFLASLYCSLAPKRYKSTTTILVVPQRVPENYVRSTVVMRVEDRLPTLQQEVMSRTRILAVVDELRLFRDRSKPMPPEAIVKEMRERIEVQVRGTSAFSLSFVHEDPKKAMMATSRLASFFIDENLRKREQQAVGTAEFLDSQLQETKAKLETQEERVKNYKMKFIGELPQQTEANLAGLARLQEQYRMNSDAIRSTEDRKALAESQLAALERSWPPALSGQGPAVAAADAPAPVAADPAAALSIEYNARRNALTQAQARYTDRHPEVVRLRAEVALLEARIAGARTGEPPAERPAASGRTSPAAAAPPIQLPNPNAAEINRLRNAIRSHEIELASLKRDRDEVRKNVATLQGRVDQSPAREQELIALTRDYDNLRRSYDDLLAKKLQADISQNLERRQKGEQFQILDLANVPELPFEPKVAKIYIVSVVVSLFLGLGGVLAFAYLDDTLRTPDEFRHYFKLPVIASLPAIQNEEATRKGRAIRTLALGGCAFVLVAATVYLTLFGEGIQAAVRKIGGLG